MISADSEKSRSRQLLYIRLKFTACYYSFYFTYVKQWRATGNDAALIFRGTDICMLK